MTALYPSRVDATLNARALQILAEDKKNEAGSFMDGAWTGHPDQNEIAVNQFPSPNQLQARRPNASRYPELRPVPKNVGKLTIDGTRAAARTVIRYRNGVLNGRGASLLDGYMEDLATDRIYRLMIAQRIIHRDGLKIVDGNDSAIRHTPEVVSALFDEELKRILHELPAETDEQAIERYRLASRTSEEMISRGEFDPV
jgi:malate synthase